MDNIEQLYRDLQRHLDKQPIGFPATKSGAEIRILKRLFTPDQARLAAYLDYRPSTAEQVHERARDSGLSQAEVQTMLAEMVEAGAIGLTDSEGRDSYHTIPFVIGMYEFQAGRLTPEFKADADAYLTDRAFGLSFLSTEVPQMRTIPVEKSLTVEHAVTSYDALAQVLNDSEGPFSVGPCVCKQAVRMQGKSCEQTARLETCMALGSMAKPFIGRHGWRQITRDEALEIARLNQEEGLVLQPSNTQRLEFICACCRCCCGMLGVLRSLPKPVDFWATNFFASTDPSLCNGCGTCVDRCAMEAITLADGAQIAHVDLDRCIGCGNCVTTCPTGARALVKKSREVAPPLDLEGQYATIMAHKKGTLGKMKVAAKLVLKV